MNTIDKVFLALAFLYACDDLANAPAGSGTLFAAADLGRLIAFWAVIRLLNWLIFSRPRRARISARG
jgi:uncharacterized membrane protein YczE